MDHAHRRSQDAVGHGKRSQPARRRAWALMAISGGGWRPLFRVGPAGVGRIYGAPPPGAEKLQHPGGDGPRAVL